jgi:hypothetical protein
MTRTFLDAGDEVWERVFWTEEQLDAHLRHVKSLSGDAYSLSCVCVCE